MRSSDWWLRSSWAGIDCRLLANDDSTLSIATPAAGLTLKLVTVVVRDSSKGEVLANDAPAFHSS